MLGRVDLNGKFQGRILDSPIHTELFASSGIQLSSWLAQPKCSGACNEPVEIRCGGGTKIEACLSPLEACIRSQSSKWLGVRGTMLFLVAVFGWL